MAEGGDKERAVGEARVEGGSTAVGGARAEDGARDRGVGGAAHRDRGGRGEARGLG